MSPPSPYANHKGVAFMGMPVSTQHTIYTARITIQEMSTVLNSPEYLACLYDLNVPICRRNNYAARKGLLDQSMDVVICSFSIFIEGDSEEAVAVTIWS